MVLGQGRIDRKLVPLYFSGQSSHSPPDYLNQHTDRLIFSQWFIAAERPTHLAAIAPVSFLTQYVAVFVIL